MASGSIFLFFNYYSNTNSYGDILLNRFVNTFISRHFDIFSPLMGALQFLTVAVLKLSNDSGIQAHVLIKCVLNITKCFHVFL